MSHSVRETSLAVYTEIKENGLLSKSRFDVYCALYEHGPCTINELYKQVKWKARRENVQANFHARMGELRDRGVVKEVRERACTVTGHQAIEWDVTKRLPVDPMKPTKVKCPTCRGKGHIEQGRLL